MTIHTMPSVAAFALKYAGWHSFAKDKLTVESVCAASNLGIIEVSAKTNQFRLKSENAARQYCESHNEAI